MDVVSRIDPDADADAGARAGVGSHPVALIATLVLVVLAYQLNATMVSPSLPAMAEGLGVGVGEIAQVTSYFFLAGAIGGVVLSRWSDVVGRKTALLVVLCLLAAGTLICLMAPNLPWMLAGRLLQGTAAASFQLAYLILRERVSPKMFGVALGVITACNGGLLGLDGPLGGALTAEHGFRATFGVILTVIALSAIGTIFVVPADDSARHSTGRMDWWGAAALSIALVATSQYVNIGAATGWITPASTGVLVLAIGAFSAFWCIERRGSSPLVATGDFTSAAFWPVLLTTGLSLAALFPVLNFTVVMISQDAASGFAMSPSLAALCFLTPAALMGLLAAPLAGWVGSRYGWVRVLRVGLAVSAVVLAAVACLPITVPVVVIAAALLGVSYNGMVLTAVNGLAVTLSPAHSPAALPSLNSAAFGLGISVGVAVVAPHLELGSETDFQRAFWIGTGLVVLALAATFLIRQQQRGRLGGLVRY